MTENDLVLNVDLEDVGAVSVLSIAGSLDAVSAPELKAHIEKLLAGSRIQVVVDLARLELIDSSGVAAIVSLFKRVRSLRGDVVIGSLTGQPAEIFRLLRLDRAFDVFDNRDAAIARFGVG